MAAGVGRRRADARILLRMRISMHETPSLRFGATTILPTGLGGSCAWGRNTGKLGTRPGRSLPTHSRHDIAASAKKAPAVEMGRLVRAPSLPAGSYTWSQILLRLGECSLRANLFATASLEGNFLKVGSLSN